MLLIPSPDYTSVTLCTATCLTGTGFRGSAQALHIQQSGPALLLISGTPVRAEELLSEPLQATDPGAWLSVLVSHVCVEAELHRPMWFLY